MKEKLRIRRGEGVDEGKEEREEKGQGDKRN